MGAKRVLTHTRARTRAHGHAHSHAHTQKSSLVLYLRLYTPTPSSPYQLSVRILGEHTLPLAPTPTRARTGAHIGGSQQRSGQRTTERARDQIVNLPFPRLILVQVQQLQQQTGLPANSETPPALQTASDWSSSRLLLWRLRILSLIFSSGYRECTPPLRDKLSLRTLSALFVF